MFRALTRITRRFMDASIARGIKEYPTQIWLSKLPYSFYGYGIYHGADLARRLNIPRISIIEFGVAGGRGLLAMEAHAEKVTRLLGVKIDIFGFDTGTGLVLPKDYRDMPYRFAAGNYSMDIEELRARLKNATLVLGDVKDTTKKFLDTERLPPIGFVSFDMDFYSSTMDALQMFAGLGREGAFLPRMQLYFDDVVGKEISSYNEFVGELAAIRDFNATNEVVKIAPNRRFLASRAPRSWHHKMYLMHRFSHPLYDQYIASDGAESLSLRASDRGRLER